MLQIMKSSRISKECVISAMLVIIILGTHFPNQASNKLRISFRSVLFFMLRGATLKQVNQLDPSGILVKW